MSDDERYEDGLMERMRSVDAPHGMALWRSQDPAQVPGARRWWLSVYSPVVAGAVGLLGATTIALGGAAVVTHLPIGATHATPSPVATVTTSPAVPSGRVTASAAGSASATVHTMPPATGHPPSPSPSPPSPAMVWPSATNTGVPAGTVLTKVTTQINVTTPGTVLTGLDVEGTCIEVHASNVTISNTLIHSNNGCGAQHSLILVDNSLTGVVVKDTEIDGIDMGGLAGIQGGNVTCLRCNIHSVPAGVWFVGGTVSDSFIHDMSPNNTVAPIWVGGSVGPIVLVHNTLRGGSLSAADVDLVPFFAPITNVQINDNLLTGGRYCYEGGSQGGYGAQSTNIVVTGNHFSRTAYPNCGSVGPHTNRGLNRPGMVWSGNVWDDTGQVIP